MASAKKLAKQLELLEKLGFTLQSTMNQFELLTNRPAVSCFANNAIIDERTLERNGAGAITTDGKEWSRDTTLNESELRRLRDVGFAETSNITSEFLTKNFKPKQIH